MRENSQHDTLLSSGWGVGRVVAGRYRLRSLLGTGAMGVVWRADDLRLDREVALKQLRVPPGLAPEETARARQRVFREGRVAARLQHPHAVAVYDVAADDSGQPMLVLEFLPSRSLATALTEHGALPPARVARIGAPVASALAAAHAAGVVHRDVKPGNVLLDGDGGAKITDFGLSHIAGDVGDGLVAGTPVFLSPEAAMGERPSPASDVFSLGATLYMAVEGRPPFGKADNPMAQLERVAAGQAPPPRRAGPLTALLTSMLHDDPASRPTMARVADTLADIAANHPADDPPLGETPIALDGTAADDLTVDGIAAGKTTSAAADDITLDRIDTRGTTLNAPPYDETAFDRTTVHGVVTDRPTPEEPALDETAVHGVLPDRSALDETTVHRAIADESDFGETAAHRLVGEESAFGETASYRGVGDGSGFGGAAARGVGEESAFGETPPYRGAGDGSGFGEAAPRRGVGDGVGRGEAAARRGVGDQSSFEETAAHRVVGEASFGETVARRMAGDEEGFGETAVHRGVGGESDLDETTVHGVVGDENGFGETAVHGVGDDSAFVETTVHGVVGDETAFQETTVHVVVDRNVADDVTLDGLAAASGARSGGDDDVAGTSLDLEPADAEPPEARRRSRRVRAVVLGVLALVVVALLVLLATGVFGQPEADAGAAVDRTAPPPSATGASTVPQAAPSGGGPAPTVAAPAVDAAVLERVVADYYALLPDQPAAAWALLGPAMRSQDRAAYDRFWSAVNDLRLRAAPVAGGNAVVVEIEYTVAGRGRVRETHQHEMVVDGTRALINSDQVLSTADPGSGGKDEPARGPGERPR